MCVRGWYVSFGSDWWSLSSSVMQWVRLVFHYYRFELNKRTVRKFASMIESENSASYRRQLFILEEKSHKRKFFHVFIVFKMFSTNKSFHAKKERVKSFETISKWKKSRFSVETKNIVIKIIPRTSYWISLHRYK